MALFGRKKQIPPLPPVSQWEYRCGDGHHWGFHYRVTEEPDRVRLTYSRTMPERMESIAAPPELWQQLAQLGDRAQITAWNGYNECRLRTPRTKRWLLYITFTDGTHTATIVLADLIAKGEAEAVYVLTLGAANTLTLNGEAIDF